MENNQHFREHLKKIGVLVNQQKYQAAFELAQQLHNDYPQQRHRLPNLEVLKKKVQIENLYTEALNALQKGDQQKAKKLLLRVKELAPGYRKLEIYLPIANTNVLSIWNPLDYFLLLWWIFVNPKQLEFYRGRFGYESTSHSGKWLVSTLAWLPLFLSNLIFQPIFSFIVFFAWLLNGWLGDVELSGETELRKGAAAILWIILIPVGAIIPFGMTRSLPQLIDGPSIIILFLGITASTLAVPAVAAVIGGSVNIYAISLLTTFAVSLITARISSIYIAASIGVFDGETIVSLLLFVLFLGAAIAMIHLATNAIAKGVDEKQFSMVALGFLGSMGLGYSIILLICIINGVLVFL